ncbi:MAG: type III secretion inner membrane ring lipoprotein SctJ [Pseudomonadota bacterium]
MHKRIKISLIALCLLAVSGCKEVLFSNLDEIQANEMVAVLAVAGIGSSRERDKDQSYSVLVEGAHVATATTILRNEGFPRKNYESLGDVFSAQGIVGTPFEQQARYVHAMNQELSHTISTIHGIQSARVLVTAPVRDRYAREDPKATASVTINYEPSFDAEHNVSRIKMIVAHSMSNLAYDDVALALFPTATPTVQVTEPKEVIDLQAMGFFSNTAPNGGINLNARSLLIALGLLSSLLCAVIIVRWYMRANDAAEQ